VLGVKNVGVNDDFFEMGGHSLLATQMVSRLKKAFKVEVALRQMFETPRMGELAESIQSARGGAPVGEISAIRRETLGDALPMSFAQQRIWFITQLAPDSAAYNIVQGVQVSGRLDVLALEQAINEVVRRHEVLRTAFTTVDGQPVQVIAPRLAMSLQQVSLITFPDIEQQTEIRRLAAEDASRPFDLTQRPLLRITLLRLQEERYAILFTMHHIISDAWSLGVLIRETASLYEAFLRGIRSPLRELPIQYRDYARWQREWSQGPVMEAQLSYWKRRLEGPLPALDLPTDYPRTSIQDRRGATRSLVLPESLSESIKSLSRRQGSTLTMTLLAAFEVLLHRLTRQDDIILGMTIANRNRSEIEGLIGFFVNTLALRTEITGDLDFVELLGRVREACLEAYGHQDLPFEKLVEEIRPERKLNHNPVFDILFNSLNAPLKDANLPGVAVTPLERIDPESKFVMTLNVEEVEKQIGFRLVYQRALFSSDHVICLLNQYSHLLQQIVANPEAPIRSYSLVTPDARERLPEPRAFIPEPPYEPVTRLFASWAEHAPQLPAVSQGERTYTYGELGEAVRALAESLRSRGIERGEVVAITGPRSFGLTSGMMAALSCGGVLMPIDLNLPPHRKQLMMREAGARWLLCVGDPTEESWAQERAATIIALDPKTGLALEPALGASFKAGPLSGLSADGPAYIFFTSGTTGMPKAVLGRHKGLSHFLCWQRQEFSVGPGDRCAQLTNLSFDVVLRDTFLPLISGATLCLPESDDLPGSEKALRWLERERISLLHVVPTLAQLWLGSVSEGLTLGALRWVFFAGEPLTEMLIRRWRDAFPQAGGIVNLYGPTETTLAKCFYRVPSEVVPGIQPLGRPIPQTQALVLTDSLDPCGIGEPGQIVVRTPYRSLGYLNAPDDNRKRFIANPFSGDERDLLYLTGDIGRFRLDGTLEILGRSDHQIKIRGVRVEPDEVAATLSEHPAVSSCVVVGSEDDRGEKMLVAYLVLSNREEATAADLRSYLSRQLPLAMVPSIFMFLERMPLKPNGKLDRQSLPAPARTGPDADKAFVAARTPVEAELAQMWAEVLGLEQVSAEDNFFDLGGHSLLAMQIQSRIRDAFQVEMPLHKLFEEPTVAGLARIVDSIRVSGRGLQTSPAGPISLKEAEQLLTSLDRLSDQEVDAMLGDLLSKSDPEIIRQD
jgi:amino acid adenylation domain-containing protein